MRYMVDTWDIDLSRSRVAENVGFCNLASPRRPRLDRRDRRRAGAAPQRASAGALMEAVLEVAPPTVMLEVIEQNEPAIRLYESLGFEKTRILEVWR